MSSRCNQSNRRVKFKDVTHPPLYRFLEKVSRLLRGIEIRKLRTLIFIEIFLLIEWNAMTFSTYVLLLSTTC